MTAPFAAEPRQFQTAYLMSIDPTSGWQPRGGSVRILIENPKDDVIGKDVVVLFGWTTNDGGSNWMNARNVRVAHVDTSRKIVLEAEVPNLPAAPAHPI